jgi:hypothetical protein
MISQDTIQHLLDTCKKAPDLKPQIKLFMNDKTLKYPQSWKLFRMAYHELYLNGSPEEPLCPVCQIKPLKFKGIKGGYANNCSISCRSANPDVVTKAKKTTMEVYGTEWASQSKTFRDQVINTCLEKYGTDNVFKVEEIKQKQVKTVVDRYGVTNVSKNSDILKKINDVHVAQGRRRADHLRSELEKYRLAVKSITARSYHDYYVINPDNLPRSRFEYHVDHIYSVEEGFKNNVPAEVIGHYTNLRMMWHLDNCRKNTKCHITLEQLLERYNNSINNHSGTNSVYEPLIPSSLTSILISIPG